MIWAGSVAAAVIKVVLASLTELITSGQYTPEGFGMAVAEQDLNYVNVGLVDMQLTGIASL